MISLRKLRAAGFTAHGAFTGRRPAEFSKISGVIPVRPGVYAFVIDGEVVYVGSANYLDRRLNSYLSILRREQTADSRTPRLVVREIRAALMRGKRVSIMVCQPAEILCGGIKIDPTLSLEKALIGLCAPRLNVRHQLRVAA
jgi:hypothetical protein